MQEYVIENVRDFYPEHIFECGQCFRWNRQDDGSYTGTAMGRTVNIRLWPEGDEGEKACAGKVIIKNASPEDYEKKWKEYLDMNRDYGRIKQRLSTGDEVMENAVAAGRGIRILKQDLWETIVSFIISQNNNIPRIKGCIEKLSVLAGERLEDYDGHAVYALPTVERLASMEADDLAPVRLGYRAPYLIKTARMVAEKGLPENYEEVSALCGVGPKVANCITLFGLHDLSSFPIDVWVRRVMSEMYGFEEKDVRKMAAFAEERFGELGGIAQQYLFYYIRSKKGEN